MMRLLAVCCCLSLAGCVSADPTPYQLAQNEQKCSAFGFQPGTQAHAECQMRLAQSTTAQNQSRINRAGDRFAAMASAPPPAPVVFPQPQQTTVIIQPRQPTLSETVLARRRSMLY